MTLSKLSLKLETLCGSFRRSNIVHGLWGERQMSSDAQRPCNREIGLLVSREWKWDRHIEVTRELISHQHKRTFLMISVVPRSMTCSASPQVEMCRPPAWGSCKGSRCRDPDWLSASHTGESRTRELRSRATLRDMPPIPTPGPGPKEQELRRGRFIQYLLLKL